MFHSSDFQGVVGIPRIGCTAAILRTIKFVKVASPAKLMLAPQVFTSHFEDTLDFSRSEFTCP